MTQTCANPNCKKPFTTAVIAHTSAGRAVPHRTHKYCGIGCQTWARREAARRHRQRKKNVQA